jgi:hypothetical protein
MDNRHAKRIGVTKNGIYRQSESAIDRCKRLGTLATERRVLDPQKWRAKFNSKGEIVLKKRKHY